MRLDPCQQISREETNVALSRVLAPDLLDKWLSVSEGAHRPDSGSPETLQRALPGAGDQTPLACQRQFAPCARWGEVGNEQTAGP
jgi:hypothetical protein